MPPWQSLLGGPAGRGVNRGGAIVIVGQGALQADDGHAVLGHAMRVADSLDARFMVLHTAAARVGGMDLGFVTEGGLSAALDGADNDLQPRRRRNRSAPRVHS